MRFTKLKVIGVAAGVAAFALMNGPVAAGSTSLTDANGVDYDAACQAGTWPEGPPVGTAAATADSIQSGVPAGGSAVGGGGCAGVSVYDGSTLAADVTAASLSTDYASPCNGDLCVQAQWTHRQNLVTPGSTNRAAVDQPADAFTGVTSYLMFQNKHKQTNIPYPGGGCIRPGGISQVLDQHGSWKDGYHFFLAYAIQWDGLKWIHSAHVGEYDPSPDGGFGFFVLGTNDGVDDDLDGSLWDASDLFTYRFGVDWTAGYSGSQSWIRMKGVHESSSSVACGRPGILRTAYVTPGDVIANVKAVTTVDTAAVRPPIMVPLSLSCRTVGGLACIGDTATFAGFLAFADVTDGSSNPGLVASNVPGISLTFGASRSLGHSAVGRSSYYLAVLLPTRVGVLGGIALNLLPTALDTLGDGPTCPTPTLGGSLPPNPLFTPDMACQIDDDPVARGSFLAEFWETTYGFTA